MTLLWMTLRLMTPLTRLRPRPSPRRCPPPAPLRLVRYSSFGGPHQNNCVQVGEITLDPPALPREMENPQEVGIYINDIMRYFSKNEARQPFTLLTTCRSTSPERPH